MGSEESILDLGPGNLGALLGLAATICVTDLGQIVNPTRHWLPDL